MKNSSQLYSLEKYNPIYKLISEGEINFEKKFIIITLLENDLRYFSRVKVPLYAINFPKYRKKKKNELIISKRNSISINYVRSF